jgi:hypothetical protein
VPEQPPVVRGEEAGQFGDVPPRDLDLVVFHALTVARRRQNLYRLGCPRRRDPFLGNVPLCPASPCPTAWGTDGSAIAGTADESGGPLNARLMTLNARLMTEHDPERVHALPSRPTPCRSRVAGERGTRNRSVSRVVLALRLSQGAPERGPSSSRGEAGRCGQRGGPQRQGLSPRSARHQGLPEPRLTGAGGPGAKAYLSLGATATDLLAPGAPAPGRC